jgi:WD40 repeat protein
MSADSHWLVTGSTEDTARLWDLTDSTTASIPLRGHSDGLLAIAVSPDSQWVVTGGLDNSVRLWSLTEPTAAPRILRGHTAWVG